MKKILSVLSIVSLVLALPKVGEQFTYKVKISIVPQKGNATNMELTLVQKIKAVGADKSIVIEITPKFPSSPSHKQPPQQPTSFTIKIDKNGKASFLTQQQSPLLASIPPSFVPFLAATLPIPKKFAKGSTLKLPDPNNPKSHIILRHLGESTYKGQKCVRVSMTIPEMSYSMSSPQSNMKTTIKGNGTFLVLASDVRILQGKFNTLIQSKGYYYNPQKQKVNVDEKSTIILEIEKL
ncbi:hypothetical protein H5T88_03410 [bacterium]|nr:hypothetical protein [bacterium]